jgi:hypothetical protein
MRWGPIGMLSLALLLAGGHRLGLGQEPQPTEYQIKAAFLFNFARFVEWPKAAFPNPGDPLLIGVLGDNPFQDQLEKTILNKKIDDHPLVTKQFHSVADATNCHILFISTSEKPRLPQIIKTLEGRNVLTVSEMDRFNETGGMINFTLEAGRVRFRINNDAATSAGLKISSKLLTLALR